MSNVATNYRKILEVLKSLDIDHQNLSSCGRPKKMSDLEVIALSLTAEYLSIDSENSLFKKIETNAIENLLERSQYNKRRKALFHFNETIRQKIAACFLEFEDCYVIDSMPLEI